MEDLPNIDIILINHDHYDHLDIPSLQQLTENHQPIILVRLGVKRRLESMEGNNIIELDWWHEFIYSSGRRIIFVPSRHNSGRGIFDKNKTLWGDFIIEGSAGNILFMGDTGDAHEKDLKVALKKYNVPEPEFWIFKFGEGREVPK